MNPPEQALSTNPAGTAMPRRPGGPGRPDLGLAVLEPLIAGSPDLIAVTEPDGRLLLTNHPASTPNNDARWSRSLYELLLPESRDTVRQANRRVLATGQAARIEIPGRRRDGSDGRMLLTISPIAREGVIFALFHVGTDITERHEEEERLRRAEALMTDTQGMAHLGIWEWDITQPHARWTPGLYAIYGLDPRTHVPTYEDYLQRVHPEDRERVMQATNRAFHEHHPYSHDERVYRADGSVRYLHTWAVPILDGRGRLVRLMGVCQDITDRKEAEIALQAHAVELARSNAELEQFYDVASHDLQEPLRAVASYVQLLERRYADRLDEAAREAIRYAVDGVKRMKALIGDVVEFSHVRSAQLATSRVSLAEALARAESALEPAIRASGASILHGELPAVRAESALVGSLLQNLLSNAIKFRSADPPRIRIDAAVESGHAHVTVADNGVGIPEAQQQRVFEVFQRLHPEMPGTGIGLALCRKIVERHGGRIWITGEPGAGTRVHFTLPLA